MKFHELIRSVKSRGSFLQNLVYTFSSNAVVYLVNLLSYPILARIFSPEAYAEYAIWTILLNNLSAFANLGYNDALIVAKHRIDYYRIAVATTYLCIMICLISALIYSLAGSYFWRLLEADELWWITFLFVQVTLVIAQNIFVAGNVRFGGLVRNAKLTGYFKVIAKMVVLTAGYLGIRDGFGLYLGDLVFSALAVIFILPFKKAMLYVRELCRFQIVRSTKLLFQNIDFPKYLFPTLWIVALTQQIPLIFISNQYDSHTLGLYSFCWGLLVIPVALIMKSIRPVFFQKNIQMRDMHSDKKKKNVRFFLRSQLWMLSFFCVCSFLAIEYGYEQFFGDKWIGGEKLMQSMIIGACGILVGSPMSSILKVNEKLKLDFVIRAISILFLILVAFLFSGHLQIEKFAFVYNIAFFLSFVWLLFYQLREFGFSLQESLFEILILVLTILLLSIAYFVFWI